ncbi:MAG: hypothetical protein WC353_04785 [Candidatus Peribacter sp.]|jgi:hypothetical protein
MPTIEMTPELRAEIIKEWEEDFAKRSARKKHIRELRKEIQRTSRQHKRERKIWIIRVGSEVGNKANQLLQSLMFLSSELMESAMNNIDQGRLLSAISSIRSHYEVTGTIAYLLVTLRRYAKNEINSEIVLSELKPLTIGVGPKIIEEFSGIDVLSINSNDRIKAIDKTGYYPEKTGAFWKFYGDLCEFVHINYSATHMTLRYEADGSVCLYDYDKVLEQKEHAAMKLSVSGHMFLWFYKESMHILNQKEKIPTMLQMPKFTFTIQRLFAENYLKSLKLLKRLGLWKPKKKESVRFRVPENGTL